MSSWQQKYQATKSLLFSFWNKELLVFLFFLFISATFWVLVSLNDFYEREIKVAVEIVDVPHHMVVTESLPDTIRATVRDKGFNLLKYTDGKNVPLIHLSFSNYAKGNGRGQLTNNDIIKALRPRLSSTASVVAIKAERLDFYYCRGASRRVPLVIDGTVTAGNNYYISRLTLTPDSVTIMADEKALDTIKVVYTTTLNIENVTESTTQQVPLQTIRGAKLSVREASLGIIADKLTEVMVRVPIKTTNVPEGVALKTFPAQVDVRVAVGLKNSPIVKPERFVVLADYNDIADDPKRMPLRISQQPRGIVRATLVHSTVEYLLETNE